MPFYELDNYFENEINNQDVYFLIWYFINTIQESKFISPLNDFIFNSGDNIMEIYEREWENAPINEHLQSFYQIKENETYCFRERIFTYKKSYDYSGSLNQIDEIILLGMVKWRNEWWFSGVSFTQSFNADLILDEKIHYPVEALLTLSTTNNLIQPIY